MNLLYTRKDDYGYIRWAQEVKRRDNYTCVICGRRGVVLHSHHLNAWASFPEQRYDVANGATLCQDLCHQKFHEIYKKGKNTKEQFEEFKSIMETMIGIANNESIIESSTKKMIYAAERDDTVQKILQELEKNHGDSTDNSGSSSET